MLDNLPLVYVKRFSSPTHIQFNLILLACSEFNSIQNYSLFNSKLFNSKFNLFVLKLYII